MSHCLPRNVNLPRAAGAVLLAWLWMSGGVLAVRRATGATRSLEPAALLSVGLSLAAIACFIHLSWTMSDRPVRGGRSAVVGQRWAITAGLAMSGFGAGTATTSWWTGLAFWALIVAEEVWSWQRVVRARPARGQVPPHAGFGIAEKGRGSLRAARRWVRSMMSVAPTLSESSPAVSAPAAEVDGHVWQRYVRSVTDAGQDLVRGTLRVTFIPGARLAAAHVAFCPPFTERPQFEARQTAGPAARLKVAQILPQGARLEVRLPAPATGSERAELSFTAIGNSLA